MPQCTAKVRKTGERCKRWAVTGYAVCQVHGAGSKNKPGGRPVQHGRYSKYLPTRLVSRYQEAKDDPELLNLRDEIGVLDSRLSELLTRVDTGEASELWMKAHNAFHQFKIATAAKRQMEANKYFFELESILGEGLSDAAAWMEISSLIDQRRKLVESERKRLVEMQQMISVERAMILIGAIAAVIKENVTDRTALANISAELNRLTSLPAG